MMISEESTERYWKRKREFFEDKIRINAVLQYIAVRKQRHSNKQNYKAYSKLESWLRKASRDSWKKPSEKKWRALREFYASINRDSARFSASFIIVNNPSINYNSLERLLFLDARHETKQTNHIVEKLPHVLSYSLERTRSIYAFLDARHETKQTNHIVEKLPSVLGSSLERTRSVYEFLDARHKTKQTNHIVETMPSVLSSSLKRTRSIYAFLDTRHETQQTNHIVETSPQVLSYSLERTRSIYAFLDARHETQQTNHIVETLPPVLGYSLERTRSIYEFLDTRHETQQTNHIVETLPSVLSYSLERTRSIYRNLEKKVNNANEYIASFPLILYLSPETVESSSLNQLLNIVRKLEERVQKREIPLIGEFGDRTDRVMYQEFINAE